VAAHADIKRARVAAKIAAHKRMRLVARHRASNLSLSLAAQYLAGCAVWRYQRGHVRTGRRAGGM